MRATFDDAWEYLYRQGGRHRNRYPYNSVVQFVFRHCPNDVPRDQVRILEVGCGAGNNLWFAAREGFRVAGIDTSPTAIGVAAKYLAEDGLDGDLRIGDMTVLPFDDASFDMVIDRAALSHTPKEHIAACIAEARRVLKAGGKFHFNPFGISCTSAQPGAHDSADAGGTLTGITRGTLAGAGLVCVYSRREIEALFVDGWNLFSLTRVEQTEMIAPEATVHEEWVALVEKTVNSAG